MKVKAQKGMKIPFHHRPQEYIPEDRFVDVGDEPYYRFIANDGDLTEATDAEWAAQLQADAKAQADAQAAADAAAAKAAKAAAKVTASTN